VNQREQHHHNEASTEGGERCGQKRTKHRGKEGQRRLEKRRRNRDDREVRNTAEEKERKQKGREEQSLSLVSLSTV
jgi:hypothetical protein